MRYVLALAALAVAGSSLAAPSRFPVELEQVLNGLDIVATTSPGSLTVLTLRNKSKVRADCWAEFDGGLATPVRRSTRVAPGKSATLSYTAKDDIARLHVKLTCTPSPADK